MDKLKNMKKTTKNNIITYALVIAAFVIMQSLINAGSISSLLEGLMVPLCIYIIMAVSLNLVVGVLGELSLGHAGFMCVGAFASAFFSKCMRDTIESASLRFFLALLIGIAAAAIFGILIGIPVLRLKGDYLAIVTLAFGEIIKNLVNVLYIGKDSNGAVAIRGSSDYAYGYDVMMAKKIGEALGQQVQIVKLDWDSLIPAVMSGDVDCVIAGQSITAERAAQVDFSNPYYYASIVTLTKKDSAYANAASVADLAGATATSQLGTIWYDTCLPQIENANILPAQETAPAMLVALNSGACDIVVTDRPTAQAALVAYPDFTLLDFGGGDNDFKVSEEDINIGISMKKGNTALQSAINEVLSTMTADDYNAMMDDAISVQPLSE